MTKPKIDATRSHGFGLVHEIVVRAILSGAFSERTLRVAIKQHISGRSADALLTRMVESGWIAPTDVGYAVTDAGLALVPGYSPPVAIRPYVPPRPAPRRPGSMDYARHPSVSAGVARPYWAAQ